jgi:hypothetical protein
MTVAYIATASIGLNLPVEYSKPIGVVVAVIGLIGLVIAHNRKAAAASV